jgi:glucose/arabinose dehydrogenase
MTFTTGIVALIFLASSLASDSTIKVGSTDLKVVAHKIKDARSVGDGERGPALAVLSDNTVLLGGGSRGGSVYSWRESDKKLKLLGNLMSVQERKRDARFAITDIAVLSQNATTAELLVSYPRLVNNNCVEVVVHRATFNRKANTVKKQERWFRSTPCVPVSAVQHAAGRMEVIDSASAYLTVGDLGYSAIDNKSKRGDLGSIFKITRSKVTKISSGHRNPQGIVLFDRKTLLASEHGPRGGDEINIIRAGNDYGWPFVTYGQPYSSGDYVKPKRTGVHDGYPKPITTWTPSIAPTELVQLPAKGYDRFNKGLVMGSLRQEALIFMRYSNQKISERVEVPIDARIRDLDLLRDGRLIATTDDGRLLIIR